MSKWGIFTVLIAILAISILSVGCSTVPVTGRTQINTVSDSKVVEMTIAEFQKMKASMPISKNTLYNEMLQNVGNRISQEVFWDMPLAEWEFVVFDMPNDINAFAMPGGKVGVFTGLFRIIRTEDELAAVVAHEIAHVTARHTHERLSQMGLLTAGSNTLGVATIMGGGGLVGSLAGQSISNIYNVGAGNQINSWDRNKEAEADQIGIIYMARAGYDPNAAIRVMERMTQLEGGAGASQTYNSTHPSSSERLDALYTYLDEAMVLYEEAKEKQTDDYFPF